MKKVFLFLFFQVLISSFLLAQTEELLIKKNEKGFFLEHKVTPKENFYSVGRLFNVNPKHLASFNGLNMSKGLNLGEVIRIPLTDSNFSQSNNEGTPVFYKTSEMENLSRISAANNKVSMQDIRKWNNLSGDNVASGAKLIVGFLVTKEMNQLVVTKKEEPIVTPKKNQEKIVSSDVSKTQAVKKDSDIITSPVKEEIKSVVKEEPKKEEPKVFQKELPGMGYFKTYFEQQVKVFPLSKEQMVTSGIFKTENGLKEAKYYALIDGVEPGTIIKITNPSNNKLIYAKVLGEMKGIKQNEGLDLRISNAAATALDVAETDKFIVKVNY